LVSLLKSYTLSWIFLFAPKQMPVAAPICANVKFAKTMAGFKLEHGEKSCRFIEKFLPNGVSLSNVILTFAISALV